MEIRSAKDLNILKIRIASEQVLLSNNDNNLGLLCSCFVRKRVCRGVCWLDICSPFPR